MNDCTDGLRGSFVTALKFLLALVFSLT